jgi:SAM-dependent methyltransferase
MSMHETSSPRASQVVTLSPREIRHEAGHCFIVDIEPGAHGELHENGRPLQADDMHETIRREGGGRYSFWNSLLYFAASDNTDPRRNGRTYSYRVDGVDAESPLFSRLRRMRRHLPPSGLVSWDPAGANLDAQERIRLLEAKVEYLLDELYTAKSQLRFLTPATEPIQRLREHQRQSFDYQWSALPYHDQFLTNEAWKALAAADVAARLDKPLEWFRGKKVLDCGCGPGRHVYAFAQMGARVVAFDTSPTGLAEVGRLAEQFPGQIEAFEHDVLRDIPVDCDFDVVWCYGVIHHTGDAFRALTNIARHVRPGGWLYLMVYTEPRRHRADDYAYRHEIHAMRQAFVNVPLERRAEMVRKIDGDRHALSWFDAISSEINDLFTTEELFRLLGFLGFENLSRTMPEEAMQNVIAQKKQAG